jgi:hypothetical protein
MKQGIKFLPPDLFNYGDNWEDYYLELKSLKKGDVFYECEARSGENYELKAIEDAKKTRNGWICRVKNSDDEVIEFFVSANTTYYGPNLFRAPQHLTQLENGQYVYVVK